MSQIYSAGNVEWVAFSWDAFAAITRRLQVTTIAQVASSYATTHAATISPIVEHSMVEEDAERWDGLS